MKAILPCQDILKKEINNKFLYTYLQCDYMWSTAYKGYSSERKQTAFIFFRDLGLGLT